MDSFGLSLGIFFIATSLLFLIDYFLVKNYLTSDFGKKINKIMVNIIYAVWLIVIIFSQFSINLRSTDCKNLPVGNAFIYTMIPNVLILFVSLLIIELYPSFLEPFSNTFGYLFVLLLGANKKLKAILKPEGKNKQVDQIYNNKSLMINELKLDNFNEFISSFKSDNLLNNSYATSDIGNLYNLIVIKTLFSKFIWIMLLGTLVIQIANTSMHTIECATNSVSEKEMNDIVKKGENDLKKDYWEQN
jgi:hypothetical protein